MFNVANMSFNAIREKKFSRKSPNLQYCFIFYEIMEPQFCLNSSLMPHSLASGSHSRFCVNDYIAKMNTKIAACSNNSSRHYGVRFHVINPVFKFQFLFSLIKYI